MDTKNPKTLFDLAIQSLLRNESVLLQALEDIPRDLFVPLFTAAFQGGHKNVVIEMVKVWPFHCLHIGPLTAQQSQGELLKATIENFPVCPAENSASWRHKLRILDLRRDNDCRTTCRQLSMKEPSCFHSCAYSDSSIRKIEGQLPIVNSGSMIQICRPVELLVDLFLHGSLLEKDIFNLFVSKIRESSGSLHICCRNLHVDKLSDSKCTLRLLDLKCVYQLSVGRGALSDITNVLSQVTHLETLSLSNVTFRSLSGRVFQKFLGHLQSMNNLEAVTLSSFCLTDHLERVLRVLPPGLRSLHLPLCNLSNSDFRFLAQSPLSFCLKLLNLNNNPMVWGDFGPFQTLLGNLSGTLEHLEINRCLINDSAISVLIPALTRCTHLRVLCFAYNPITMPVLVNILNNLTPLRKLKYVFYPIPVHCYGLWNIEGSLDLSKLAIVQLQLKAMLVLADRTDMKWITYSE